MYIIIPASKDAYISNRVIDGVRALKANTGAASSLDLYKLYGMTSSGSIPNAELTRLLVHFNLDRLRNLNIPVEHESFSCKLVLHDVYGGQPTPNNITVCVNPMSKSWNEGFGCDIVSMGDYDVCNFLSASRQSPWVLSGAAAGGLAHDVVDYIESFVENSLSASTTIKQTLTNINDDLIVDVSRVISATISGIIPDQGFRIALSSSLEEDQYTYFVKRFGARTAYNADKHPKLIVQFDDSIEDNTSNLTFDSLGTMVLRNYASNRQPTNIISGSTILTGSNCAKLTLKTEISGGYWSQEFNVSQHMKGNSYDGIYVASVGLSSSLFSKQLNESGSVKFTTIWGSIDDSIGFFTSSIIVKPALRQQTLVNSQLRCALTNVPNDVSVGDNLFIRLNAFDPEIQPIKSRVPLTNPGVVVNAYYSIRDIETNVVRIPFDAGTKISSDDNGMFFSIDTESLIVGRTYAIDISCFDGLQKQVHRSLGTFRVNQ